ncbi:MAG: hypothetical protein ACXWJK_15025 [Burkholderiaceae bacterium]
MESTRYLAGLHGTLIGAGVLAFLLLQKHSGFMILFVWLFLIPWIFYSAWVIVRQPQRRSIQAKKVFVWVAFSTIVVGYHLQLHNETRRKAQHIADKITDYMTAKGACPVKLETIGLSNKSLREEIGLSGYQCEGGKPVLFYASTYVPFETDHFDFKRREWVHIGD